MLAGWGLLYKKYKGKTVNLNKGATKKQTPQKSAKNAKKKPSRKKETAEVIEKTEAIEEPSSKEPEPQRQIKRMLK